MGVTVEFSGDGSSSSHPFTAPASSCQTPQPCRIPYLKSASFPGGWLTRAQCGWLLSEILLAFFYHSSLCHCSLSFSRCSTKRGSNTLSCQRFLKPLLLLHISTDNTRPNSSFDILP